MTEAEWRAGDNLTDMLAVLREKGSDRKIRLFACACCQQIMDLLRDPRSQLAVTVAERFADGEASQMELAKAGGGALAAAGRGVLQAGWSAYWTVSREVRETLFNTSSAAIEAAARSAVQTARQEGTDQRLAWSETLDVLTEDQIKAIRDLLGNPYAPAPRLDPAWLTWNDGTIVNLARQIYQNHAFDTLPILGDALEDAGCSEQTILGHCRGTEPHVRGCWVLDLLLGKE